MLAYIWLEKDRAEEVLRGGLAPEGEGIDGLSLPRAGGAYIAAALHPADAYAAPGGSTGSRECMRISIDARECYVIDTGRIGEKAVSTLIPADKYVLGSFRRPLLIIVSAVKAEDIKRYEGRIDAPLLYENSEKLYIDRQFALADEGDPGFRETALRAYYEKQVAMGRAVRYLGETLAPKKRGTWSVAIVETAEEYKAPDGSLLGVCLDKKITKG
ncbi:MAG: hypothetical protein J5950_05510 [Clostridia bacterium]|nr:hypothetical protein [Clostridia bacterium]